LAFDLKNFTASIPSYVAGVPTIWERIRKGILNEVNKQSYAVRQIFFAAFNAKWAMIQATGSQNVVTNAIDAAALKQAKDIVGGRLRMALTGGAGISDETHRFLSTVMCYVVSGYGLTEISGIGSVTFPRLGYRLRTVGPPVRPRDKKKPVVVIAEAK
jgi:long-chain acyl-CoA synthetase